MMKWKMYQQEQHWDIQTKDDILCLLYIPTVYKKHVNP